MAYVPPVAYTTRTTATNLKVTVNNIVYKDTVLDLKELGENIKLSHLYVKHEDVENCVNKILEGNPNVKFNVIQYSRKDGKVYFYTDKELDLSKWEDRHKETLDTEIDNDKIVKILNRTLEQKECPNDCISLNNLVEIYKRKIVKLDNIVENYAKKIGGILDKKRISLIFYDYGQRVALWVYHSDDLWEGKDLFEKTEYIFSVINDDLRIEEINGTNKDNNILGLVGKDIKDFYNIMEKESITNFYWTNLQYNIIIDKSSGYVGISIYNDDFYLSKSDGKYNLNCNSLKVQEQLMDRKDELLNKIFIPLNYCPSFVAEELEKEELERQERIKQEKEALELERQRLLEEKMKQERKDAVIRKIFPFYKRKKQKK